jgi:DNA-binding transcriptional LysR family regulator
MRARQLEVFTAVMRAGTVTAAARLLNISQPALSQILAHTEDELGFALFERVKGRLHPTVEALEIFPEAERLFASLEGLRRKTQDLRLGRAGLVRIASSAPPAMALLPHALADFRRRYPEIRLRSHVAPVATLVQMLREGDAGLALALEDHVAPDIEAEQCGETGFVCLMQPSHALAAAARVSLRDLEGEALISYRSKTRPSDELAHAARTLGLALTPELEIDVSISAVGFVQAGLGLALVDALLPWGQFQGLVARPILENPRLPVSILTSRARGLSRAEELMRASLREACAKLLGGA